jgi:hypothetical protein
MSWDDSADAASAILLSMGGYGVRLASVAPVSLARFRSGEAQLLASLELQCSPLVAKWVDLEPLGSLLARAVDGGAPLRDGLWNVVRAPLSHPPGDVLELAGDLGRAWLAAEQTPVACDDFFIGEIGRVVQLFAHAAANGHAVVSAVLPVLDGPNGAEVVLFSE